MLFGSRFISRAAKTENLVPRSFFAPKQKNGNACYAGYGKCDFNGLKFPDKRKEKLERYWLRQVYWLKLSYFHGLISFTVLFLWQNLHVARRESHFVTACRPRRTATVPVVPAQWLGSLGNHNTEVTKIASSSTFVQPILLLLMHTDWIKAQNRAFYCLEVKRLTAAKFHLLDVKNKLPKHWNYPWDFPRIFISQTAGPDTVFSTGFSVTNTCTPFKLHFRIRRVWFYMQLVI